MLVILNGAPKGGSTWLVQIIFASQLFKKIPSQYQNQNWHNSSIDPDKLDMFFSEIDYRRNNYYCKQHWRGKQKYKNLLKDRNIKMVNIIRDIRDVLVSRYFHELREGRISKKMNIGQYYWSGKGKNQVKKYIEYQTFWHESNPQPFLCSYERLHKDFLSQIRELFSYLGFMNIKDSTIEKIQQETSLKKKDTGQGKFLRKGIVGDWRNYLSEKILKDLESLTKETGYLQLKEKMSQNFNLDLLKDIDFGTQPITSRSQHCIKSRIEKSKTNIENNKIKLDNIRSEIKYFSSKTN